MKYVIEMETERDPMEIMRELEARVHDKKDDMKPGQFVVINTSGVVVKVGTITGPGKTEQSYKDDVDVNRMLEPAMRKGLLRHVTRFAGEYDDIPVESFQDAMFVVQAGKNMYEALPSKVRAKFEGPAHFMEFVQNPENKPWLQKHGLMKGLDGVDRKGNETGYNPNKQAAEPEPTPAEGEGKSTESKTE